MPFSFPRERAVAGSRRGFALAWGVLALGALLAGPGRVVRADDPGPEEGAEAEPVRVGGKEVESGGDREAAARELVRVAAAAAPDWAAAGAVAAPAGSEDLDVERVHRRAVARALETASEKHPEHWGIQ